jgi:hypothetical protein
VERFLAWAESQRLTVVRVLAMGGGFMNLSAEDGRKALPRLLESCRSASTARGDRRPRGYPRYPLDLDAQLEAIGRIAIEHENALIEVRQRTGAS